MKKSFWSALLNGALLGGVLLSASAALAQKETLAVSTIAATPSLKKAMNESGKSGSLGRVTESFDSQLIAKINDTRKFDIVGRSDLKEVLKEQELGQSGNVDAKTAAQAGTPEPSAKAPGLKARLR